MLNIFVIILIYSNTCSDYIYAIDGSIDARHNYWGFNDSIAVHGRIKDYKDEIELMPVDAIPYYSSNKSLLESEKCPPPWILMPVSNTCYGYIAVPMTFHDAKTFCTVYNICMVLLSKYYLHIFFFRL